ncbi:MAG: hypothetical protein K8S23_04680, partial [Candidatus Cloacimonetes bacterium]|nr:hypothetical protein [Candidatus Cloacimonadota bacterium]
MLLKIFNKSPWQNQNKSVVKGQSSIDMARSRLWSYLHVNAPSARLKMSDLTIAITHSVVDIDKCIFVSYSKTMEQGSDKTRLPA